jgi:hypothetical protein
MIGMLLRTAKVGSIFLIFNRVGEKSFVRVVFVGRLKSLKVVMLGFYKTAGIIGMFGNYFFVII